MLAGVAAFALAADIVTKTLLVAHLREGQPVHVLGDVLMFNLLRNPGAAFSVGTGDTIVVTAIAVAVVVYIARTARNLRSTAWAITLGLLLGGALGNLLDRLRLGYVVDFVDLGIGSVRWYTFNVADAAISVAIVLLLVASIWPSLPRRAGAPGRG